MNSWLLELLSCPDCSGELEAHGADKLACPACDTSWPVRGGIPRFTEEGEDYCGSFGEQWHTFRRTQIDEFSGVDHSARRFTAETSWTDLTGQLMLDGGCGAGRFASVALRRGARLVGIDLSAAVDACAENLRELGFPADQFSLIQGSILRPPLKHSAFDRVYSLGVVQHTPDPLGAIRELATRVAASGETAFWAYERRWTAWTRPKYWLRPATSRLSTSANWRMSRALVTALFPLAWHMRRLPGHTLALRLLPIAARLLDGDDRERARAWTLLDTFDNYSPRYDSPVREDEVRDCLEQAGFEPAQRQRTPGLALVARRTSDEVQPAARQAPSTPRVPPTPQKTG